MGCVGWRGLWEDRTLGVRCGKECEFHSDMLIWEPPQEVYTAMLPRELGIKGSSTTVVIGFSHLEIVTEAPSKY